MTPSDDVIAELDSVKAVLVGAGFQVEPIPLPIISEEQTFRTFTNGIVVRQSVLVPKRLDPSERYFVQRVEYDARDVISRYYGTNKTIIPVDSFVEGLDVVGRGKGAVRCATAGR